MDNYTLGWSITVTVLVGFVIARSIFIAHTEKKQSQSK
jgi:hypothetical protein